MSLHPHPWQQQIDRGRLARLDAAPAVDPCLLADVCAGMSVEEVVPVDDHVLVWQTFVAAGEYYLPRLTRHVVSLCMVDVPFGVWCHGDQLQAGGLSGGDLLLARAHDRAAYLRSAYPFRFLHIGLSVGSAGKGRGFRHQAAMALRDPALDLLFKAMLPQFRAGGAASHSFVAAVAQAVRAYLMPEVPHAGVALPTPQVIHRKSPRGVTDDDLAKVLAHLRCHVASPCTAAELGVRFGLDERSLARRFQQRIGETLGAYSLRLRLSHAYGLLQSGDHTVTAVAAATGFADLPHFSRQFRKFYGVTPSAVLPR